MSFQCSKLHSRCGAACCKIFPMNEILYRANEDKRTKPVVREESPRKGYIVPVTQDLSCCFLKDDLDCAIHDVRPGVCRTFGSESHVLMTCDYQNKEGEVRSRGQIRYIQKEKKKFVDGELERNKQKMHRAMKNKKFVEQLKLKDDEK